VALSKQSMAGFFVHQATEAFLVLFRITAQQTHTTSPRSDSLHLAPFYPLCHLCQYKRCLYIKR
jgi:hypothetical protein